jgi:GNAT superfamily N-acetyltransferase
VRPVDIRIARVEDAQQVCDVLRRSIEELCISDHGGDPDAIREWLANKTLDNVFAWIEDGNQQLIVAEKNGRVLGVGAATASGEITLNYVSPEARFHGISKAILQRLEIYLRENGHARCTLSSTRTAHRLYRAAGYEDAGPLRTWGRLNALPMTKRL